MSELNWRRPEPQYEAGMLRLLRLNSGVFGPADPEPAFSQIAEYQGVHPHYQLLFICAYLYTEFTDKAAVVYEASWEAHVPLEYRRTGDWKGLHCAGGGKITILVRFTSLYRRAKRL